MTAPGPALTPVTVVTGFLGSGKTTLIARLLRQPGLANTAVIVNGFGEVGLDHMMVERLDGDVVLLPQGCVCCMVNGTLADTLEGLDIQRINGEVPFFDRVVVETSGLANPAPVLQTLLAPSRRAVLGTGGAVIGWGVAQAAAQEAPKAHAAALADAMVVTLLGTGSPDPRPDRFGMSTLVQAGGLNLVFDAGRGCVVRLRQAGVALGKVDTLFITHFHSDHLNGLQDPWLTGFLPGSFGARRQPFELRGPQGIGRIATTMRATFADDVRIREEDEHVPEDRTLMPPTSSRGTAWCSSATASL